MFNLSKRQKFVIATVILLAGIILIRLSPGLFIPWRSRVIVFSALSIIIAIWALYDSDFSGIEWFTLPVLPAGFGIGSALVFPLLPARLDSFLTLTLSPDTSLLFALLIKLLFLLLFITAYYASLLTENIFNVAAVRSIQLLRVAHSIGFLLTVATALFFYIVISSLHLSSFLNFLATFLISFPLGLQAIWSINIEPKISADLGSYALVIGLVIGEIAWVLSFWPVSVSIFALFLTAIFYEVVGIIQYELGEKLNPKIANEFILVGVVVFLLTIFVTQWGS